MKQQRSGKTSPSVRWPGPHHPLMAAMPRRVRDTRPSAEPWRPAVVRLEFAEAEVGRDAPSLGSEHCRWPRGDYKTDIGKRDIHADRVISRTDRPKLAISTCFVTCWLIYMTISRGRSPAFANSSTCRAHSDRRGRCSSVAKPPTPFAGSPLEFNDGNFTDGCALPRASRALLASFLHAGLLIDDLPRRISFAETLRRCQEREVISEPDATDLRRLMDLRNPLSHFRDLNDATNLSRRVLSTMEPAVEHLRRDATFAIGLAVRMLALPAFRLGNSSIVHRRWPDNAFSYPDRRAAR